MNGTLRGGETINLRLDGSVPAGAGNLDLGLNGTVDLALLRPFIANPSLVVTGRTTLAGRVTGPLATPGYTGTIALSNGRVADITSGVDVRDLAGTIRLAGRNASFGSIDGNVVGGGTISLSGDVEGDVAGGLPVNLKVTGRDVRVRQQGVLDTTADLDITVAGRATTAPTIGGTITLGRVDVTIPDRLPLSVSTIDVIHKNPPRALAARLPPPDPRRPPGEPAAPAGPGFAAPLDLTVKAARIFVKGQGIDAQFGGSLQVRGTTAAPQILGGIELVRGTLTILTQRLEFSRGNVTFQDGLVPVLDLAASTTAGDVTATVNVTGPAAQPQITFTSSPELPQDEVISRLLFNRASQELSAAEAIQLAQAVAQLAGLTGSGPGVIDGIREKLGLDRLGVEPNESGAQLEVGKYITDNVYVGVEQGTEAGSSRVKVDIDITDNVKVQGSAGSDGSRVGIGMEWDY
ncbi:translocation/assembly module TamB domain-containing protein [Methylobrevis pamukkalensis]|uniref:Translocation and assembly module TamB C-terminal domain-containing protein n=1 Tax=Methylobrevis pamukkalensis TaxID=1439726 RepID=A0A1E3H8E9_9HYPH|nr:translocation/assembly module TamB domain-containing protein [Methylobrevis pamukkalensis]ODN72608.1 hypothetical protein A6302_00101 [Methylobrevis pamukkalensis]